MPRKDFKAIKFLYQRFGLKTAMEWQRLPFVDLSSHFPEPEELDRPLAGSFDHLPWEDAVYSPSDSSPLREFVYRLKQFKGNGQPPACECGCCPVPEDAVTLSIIALFDDGPEFAEVVIDNRRGRLGVFRATGLDLMAAEERRALMVNLARGAAMDARYLAQCPEHLIEVRPTDAARGQRAAKTARKKPWLREDLPSIILLDPGQARAHGHRVDRGGTHASPIPHQRRGHWRRLRASRFKERRAVWVRPAWIGDSEWIHDGSRYKVLHPVESDAGGQTVRAEEPAALHG